MMRLKLPDAGRFMGLHLVGAPGTRKSRLLGRRLIIGDFDRGKACVVLDPVGDTIDNALDVLVKRSPEARKAAGERIIYVDVGGELGYVCPLPVYHKGQFDQLDQVANRPIEVWKRTDPALGSAPIMGLNAVLTTGTFTGMMLSALGWRMSEAEALLSAPGRYRAQMEHAVSDRYQLREAAVWLSNLPGPKTREWHNQTDSYLNKIRQLTLNDAARATYCASEPGIDWHDVAENGTLVLVDFRGLADNDELLAFGLVWWFRSLFSYIKKRGSGRRHPSLGIVVDELTHFLKGDRDQQDLIAGDFEELVSRRARSHRVWLAVSHQELNQLSPRMSKVLLAMGTQLFSSTSDLEGGAEVWAKRFDPYVKNALKAWEELPPRRGDYMHEPQVRETYLSIQEQVREAAQRRYLSLPEGWFWGAVSEREGHIGRRPELFSISTHDGFVDEELVPRARQLLAQRSGRPIAEVLAEIDARTQPLVVGEGEGGAERRASGRGANTRSSAEPSVPSVTRPPARKRVQS